MKVSTSIRGRFTISNAATSALIFLFFTLGNSPTAADDETDLNGLDCKTALGRIIKEQMGFIKDCLAEMQFKSGKEKAEKMMCVMVCGMKKAGFLDSNGNPDAVASLNFFETKVPENLREPIMGYLMECQEHLGTIDASDPTCKTYQPMMQCAQAMFNKVCV